MQKPIGIVFTAYTISFCNWLLSSCSYYLDIGSRNDNCILWNSKNLNEKPGYPLPMWSIRCLLIIALQLVDFVHSTVKWARVWVLIIISGSSTKFQSSDSEMTLTTLPEDEAGKAQQQQQGEKNKWQTDRQTDRHSITLNGSQYLTGGGFLDFSKNLTPASI